MLIAIYTPDYMPESFRVYVDNLIRELTTLGCHTIRFPTIAKIPTKAQLLWDPRSGGANPPILDLCSRITPLVVTLHGVAPMAIPLTDYFSTPKERLKGLWENHRKRTAWRKLDGRYAAIVTVSNYSKESIIQQLPINPSRVFPCLSAVDHRTFHQGTDINQEKKYFLHISNDEPRKNVDRICAAYFQLPKQGRPQLLLKLPADNSRIGHDGIQVIRERLSSTELLRLYQGAQAFLFPSLYEGFGLPILEAMASGCPVITANSNACAEVAGDAALTVAPHSIPELRDAMQQLLVNTQQRTKLVEAGLRRAKEFSWEASARCHLKVFTHALRYWNT
jgi:glycosyltransferase involved in cell wall biosynthesis